MKLIDYEVYRNKDFTGEKFSGTTYKGIVFCGSDFTKAKFQNCVFWGCNFRLCNLKDVDVSNTLFTHSYLDEVKNLPKSIQEDYNKMPDGDLQGWKVVKNKEGKNEVIELLIPEKAKRSCGSSHFCRAEYVITQSGEGLSFHDKKTKYVKGMKTKASGFNPDRWVESTEGIHFFPKIEYAIEYAQWQWPLS